MLAELPSSAVQESMLRLQRTLLRGSDILQLQEDSIARSQRILDKMLNGEDSYPSNHNELGELVLGKLQMHAKFAIGIWLREWLRGRISQDNNRSVYPSHTRCTFILMPVAS
jgi:hypothetical protein